jgi:ABC-type molybdate transport system substrate-binding protein
MSENAITQDAQGSLFVKDPRARLDVGVDWSEWLEQEDTAVATSTWTVDPAGLTLDSAAEVAGVTKVYVSGGTVGEIYTLRNTISTAAGLIDSRSIRVAVRNR